jgi:hypothetical protein
MSQFNSGMKAFEAGAAINRYERVKLVAGVLQVAGDEEYAIGFADELVASGENCTVKLINVSGTFKAVASEAVTAGDDLYGAAAGKVETTGTTVRFVALEAASGDGSVIEVLPKSLA